MDPEKFKRVEGVEAPRASEFRFEVTAVEVFSVRLKVSK